MKTLMAVCMVTMFMASCEGQRQPWRPNYQRQPNYWNPVPQNFWWGDDFDNDDGMAWGAYMQQPYGYYQAPLPMVNPGYNPRMWGPAAYAAAAAANSNSGEVLLGMTAGGMPQPIMAAGISNQNSGEFFDP